MGRFFNGVSSRAFLYGMLLGADVAFVCDRGDEPFLDCDDQSRGSGGEGDAAKSPASEVIRIVDGRLFDISTDTKALSANKWERTIRWQFSLSKRFTH